jgi:predicted polyphosphate/ATP-dependent NAD kinase
MPRLAPTKQKGPASIKKLGLIVNPVAGVGGRVGLKGSDGHDVLVRALELGATRESPHRTEVALRRLERLRDRVGIVTFPGEMGEDEARAAGFAVEVLAPSARHGVIEVGDTRFAETTAADTEEAARRMADAGVELILFAGGDGTARNIFNAVADRVPVVGIPAGVKIHSAVYANSPANAGDLAALFLAGEGGFRLREAEVMDIDEEAFRHDRLSASLYGFLRVPYERQLIQSPKAGSQPSDETLAVGIGNDVVHSMKPGVLYLIGAGTTTRAIMRLLDLPCTLLGVDAVRDRQLVASDLTETDALRMVSEANAAGPGAAIVVTVIGGQGHIFGRGNQQLSPHVVRAVGKDKIIVVATQSKLLSLDGAPLRLDTGDEALDAELAGWIKVISGHSQRTMYRVE